MVEFSFGKIGQEDDVLDFANYVFSMVRCPIDFKKLLPKVYAREDFALLHALAMEKGRIRGTLALLPGELTIRGAGTLKIGYLGTMAVHPYARGGGLMRTLMDMIIQKGIGMGLDVLALDGRRHRYNYFGFERAGALMTFTLNADCLKHAFGAVDAGDIELVPMQEAAPCDLEAALSAYRALPVAGKRDNLMPALQSWQNQPMVVRSAGRAAGYLCIQGNTITETALPDDAVLSAYKKCLETLHGQEMKVLAYQHETNRVAMLQRVSEHYAISDELMLRVLNWPRVLQTLMAFKQSFAPLEDGRAILAIEGADRLCVAVREGVVTVQKTEEAPTVTWSHNEAVTWLFSPLTTMMPSSLPGSWLPLPFAIPRADAF